MNTYIVSVNGNSYTVKVNERRGDTLSFEIAGEQYETRVTRSYQPPIAVNRSTVAPQAAPSAPPRAIAAADSNAVNAPIPGIVSEVKVAAGDAVQVGTTLVVIEAMKMENPIRSPKAGVIETVHVAKGQEVGNGASLVTFKCE